MTDWSKIRKEFEASDITMKALAEKHDVKPSTLRSRKNREKWTRDEPNNATKKNVATQRNETKNVATQKAIEQLEQNDELNDKQKQFCLLYLKYFNATKAYQKAYDVDYSTANSHGYKLLSNVVIKEELERLKKAQRSELYVDSLDIKKEWLKQAFADITDFTVFGNEDYTHTDDFGEQEKRIRSFVRLKNDHEVDGTLVQEVKTGRDGVSLKLYDKQRALEKIEQFLERSEESGREFVVIKDEWADDDE